MKCPVCDVYVHDDDIIDHTIGKDGQDYECMPYFKCPRCKNNWEVVFPERPKAKGGE